MPTPRRLAIFLVLLLLCDLVCWRWQPMWLNVAVATALAVVCMLAKVD